MVRRLDADGQFSREQVEYFWDRERWLYVRLLKAIEKIRGAENFNHVGKQETVSAAYSAA